MSNNHHRLDGNDEDLVGKDMSDLPNGINHIINHRVPPSPPVVHNVPGPFVPFVGGGASAFHGVLPSEGSYQNDPYEQAEYQATLPTNYYQAPEEIAPVPVIIVPPNAGPESFNAWRTTNADLIVGVGVSVMGKDSRRSRMVVRNEATTATDTIRIASKRGELESGSGYLIPGGQTEEIFSQGELYAMAVVNSVQVSVLAEYVVNG